MTHGGRAGKRLAEPVETVLVGRASGVAGVDVCAGAFVWVVALRQGEEPGEAFFGVVRAAGLLRELYGACGVTQGLNRFDAGHVFEEPGATGEHEDGLALRLEQVEQAG